MLTSVLAFFFAVYDAIAWLVLFTWPIAPKNDIIAASMHCANRSKIPCTNAIYYLQNSFLDMKFYASAPWHNAREIVIVRKDLHQVIDLQTSTCSYNGKLVHVHDYISSELVEVNSEELLNELNDLNTDIDNCKSGEITDPTDICGYGEITEDELANKFKTHNDARAKKRKLVNDE